MLSSRGSKYSFKARSSIEMLLTSGLNSMHGYKGATEILNFKK